jgi:hypothetical protein
MTDETTTPATAPATPVAAAPAPPVNVVNAVPAADPVNETGVTVTSGSVTAQVTGPPEPVKLTQPVYEAHFQSDRVITDTSDPLAVQVPAASPDDAFTPIGQAHRNPVTPEEAFAAKA